MELPNPVLEEEYDYNQCLIANVNSIPNFYHKKTRRVCKRIMPKPGTRDKVKIICFYK